MYMAVNEFLDSAENESAASFLNAVITSLSGCCENFSSKIVKQHFGKVNSVIIYSLKRYFIELP